VEKQEHKTLHALPVITVNFMHVPGKPFCPNDRCPCHQNQAEIAVLLDAVWAGEMTLREAANFADGKTL
jgi:hypothetical protein